MSNKIILDETIQMINGLSNEKNKEIFCENLIKSKESIKIIDSVLEKETELDKNISIDKLFDMLEEYNKYINDETSIGLEDFKKIKDLVELIEKKLDDKVEIIEVK